MAFRWSLLVCLVAAATCASSEKPLAPGSGPAVGAPAVARHPLASPQRPRMGKRSNGFSNIVLYTQHSEPVRFYDDLVKDKVVMINFMYATCPKICPASTAQLARINDLLHDRVGHEVTMLSISIDPEVDTPARLKRYWEVFGSKPGWLFLTGEYDEIDRLRHELGVYDPDPAVDADKTQHSGVLTFGNDRTDRWSALPVLMHAKQLAGTVLRVTWDEQWKRRAGRPKRASTAPEVYQGHGILRRVDIGKGLVVIDHDEIPGLMMAMTMTFEVRDRNTLEGLVPEQSVEFHVQPEADRYRIVAIGPRAGCDRVR